VAHAQLWAEGGVCRLIKHAAKLCVWSARGAIAAPRVGPPSPGTLCFIRSGRANALMRRFVTLAFHHLQSHTMTLILHVKPNTSSKVLHSRTRLLPQLKYCNNHKWPPAFGKSIVAAEGKQRRRSRAAHRPWVENCESNRNTVRLAEMASTDRAPLASLPQHFDAALLAKFYRSMCGYA
jgi:hypothetical protein